MVDWVRPHHTTIHAGVVMFSGIRWLGWFWGRASAAA